jgi:hypothetical protein
MLDQAKSTSFTYVTLSVYSILIYEKYGKLFYQMLLYNSFNLAIY